MTTKFPSDKQDKFMLRLPDGMRDRIAQEAETNGRSMNAEIVQRLEASFRRSIDDDDVRKFSEKMREGIVRLRSEADTAKVGAAVSSHVLANILKTEMTLLPLSDSSRGTFDRMLKAAEHVVDIYKNVKDHDSRTVAEILADIDSKALAPRTPKKAAKVRKTKPEK